VKKILIPLSIIPLLVLLAWGFRTDPKAIPSPLVGKPAPPFKLQLFDEGNLSLEELRGKVVVLNFWASWCYPACYEEAPILEAGWRESRDRGVVFIGVNIQDTEPKAREFLRRFNHTFPNGPDPRGLISVDYGVYGVPETFFIDRKGMIRAKHVGAVTEPLLRQKQRNDLSRRDRSRRVLSPGRLRSAALRHPDEGPRPSPPAAGLGARKGTSPAPPAGAHHGGYDALLYPSPRASCAGDPGQ